ncbi:phosphatase PAP2 family protein [Haloferula sp. A504]|uniref:phosphatase PAP2 family protein n=1 Tax=Haloferula sp. A504 TaxID=3373601 RepID=UPI0031C3E433|nr:phosphatase PAP2 family protein [Verrucomicrobiaceae bacterium E54]
MTRLRGAAHSILLLAALALFPSCEKEPETSLSKELREIREGILEGYLAEGEVPNSLTLLPPPPEDGSAALALDQQMAAHYVALEDEARKAQAIQDNILAFPQATEAFNSILEQPISEETTPHAYMILRRTLADAGLSTYAAKNHYQRPRPFMVNDTPVLTPDEEEALRKDGSYPSGHTAVGWAWALILTELFPEQSDAILKRGKEFGISRLVCNAHWHSDVAAGRTMGAATVARLHANAGFLVDLEAAKQELRTLNSSSKP